MYGIVNKAIEGLVIENYGKDNWEKIKEKSGVSVDVFLSNEPYPDEYTYKLAIAAADILNTSLRNVLIAFGEYWVLKTGLQHYGSLMTSGGSHLKEFLINLPGFHSRVMLIYPNITPPEFKISHIDESSLQLHYFSQRNGLADFVYGLVQGLGKMYETEVEIILDQSKDKGADHDIFIIKWK
jgi:hypothetical protein